MKPALEVYEENLGKWSDVQEHLVRLFNRSRGFVVELGVRHGVSTSALLAGVEQRGGWMVSVDIDPNCAKVFAGHLQWAFAAADSEQVDLIFPGGLPKPIDLLFIDTEHTADKTLNELLAWGPYMAKGGTIFLHDTDDGSTYPGVRNAIIEYCATHDRMYWFHPGSYGLGEIQC